MVQFGLMATMTPALQILIPTASVVLAIIASHMSLRREIAGLHRSIAGLHRNIAGLHRDITGLRERMARIEGIMEALLQTTGDLRRSAITDQSA